MFFFSKTLKKLVQPKININFCVNIQFFSEPVFSIFDCPECVVSSPVFSTSKN